MTAKNDVTGDSIQSKQTSNSYRENYDKIFGKKKLEEETHENNQTNDERS